MNEGNPLNIPAVPTPAAEETEGTPLSEAEVIERWNAVITPLGGYPASLEDGSMFDHGGYHTADVRSKEPRVSATLRLSQHHDGSYRLYVNDWTYGSSYYQRTEQDYQAAVDFVAKIASELTQKGVSIARVSIQGYNDSQKYMDDINARYQELLHKNTL